MAPFRSFNDWFEFIHYTKNVNRFFLTDRWFSFIDDIASTAGKRITVLSKGTVLYRARDEAIENLKEKEDIIYPEYLPLKLEEMKAPPAKDTKEGRFTPRGISYLYLASNPETAVSEIKPWKQAVVTVATFTLLKDQKLVDTRKDSANIAEVFKTGKFSSAESREKMVWGSLDWTFANPIPPREASVGYAVTQRIAEVFKNNGFDGILYRSAFVDAGYNVVLFHPSSAKPKSRTLYEVEQIEFKIRKRDIVPRPGKIKSR